jgi:hypothetical protein
MSKDGETRTVPYNGTDPQGQEIHNVVYEKRCEACAASPSLLRVARLGFQISRGFSHPPTHHYCSQ